MNRETEIALLVDQQLRDDRDFQPPEQGTVPYGLVLDVRDQDGRTVASLPRGTEPECAIHGREDLAEDHTRGYRCRVCDRERKRAKAAIRTAEEVKTHRLKEARRQAARRSWAKKKAEKDGKLFHLVDPNEKNAGYRT